MPAPARGRGEGGVEKRDPNPVQLAGGSSAQTGDERTRCWSLASVLEGPELLDAGACSFLSSVVTGGY